MTQRKLVTVRRVRAIEAIPDADKIELVHIDGWKCVSKKGEFQVNDLGVYFEIDSFLPISDPRFAFLEKNKIIFNGVEGARIRSMTLRGALSQGLLLPLKLFPEVIREFHKTRVVSENNLTSSHFDATKILGIGKWEAPIPTELSGRVIGGFPSFIPKTDQERIQNLPHLLKDYADVEFEISRKLDGTSMTVYHFDGRVGVCGRNWEFVSDSTDTLSRIARDSGLIDVIKECGNVAIQGELIGPGVNGNREKADHHSFNIFDVYDIDAGSYMLPDERRKFVAKLVIDPRINYSLCRHVPVPSECHTATLSEFASVEDILAFANDCDGEGYVFKAKRPDKYGRVVSFKVISNRYIMDHDG